MAKTLIGNIKGKNGRGITSIKKTGTTGSIDTYTITYTDSTTSTFTINNADNVLLQRQIVPSAAVESSAIASQAYAAGDYVVVNGVLRKVTAAIAKGNTIGDSNSTATTVTGELVNSTSRVVLYKGNGFTAGTLPGISAYKTIEVYITADTSATSNTYVCIRCSREDETDPFRGLSGSGFGGGDMRIVGVNMHNRSGDVIEDLGTTAYRISNGSISKLDDRPIRVIIGVEKF